MYPKGDLLFVLHLEILDGLRQVRQLHVLGPRLHHILAGIQSINNIHGSISHHHHLAGIQSIIQSISQLHLTNNLLNNNINNIIKPNNHQCIRNQMMLKSNQDTFLLENLSGALKNAFIDNLVFFIFDLGLVEGRHLFKSRDILQTN